MLAVAKQFGYARIVDDQGNDIAPALPAEPSRLAALRDAVDIGYRRFIAAKPNWTWLQQTITVVLDPTGVAAYNGDTSRYLLPVGVASRPQTSWLATLPSGEYIGKVLDTSATRVLSAMAAYGSTVGPPRLAAVRPVPGGVDGGTSWEVVLTPRPDQAYAISGEFRLQPVVLSELTDRHAAGSQHDQAIMDMCKLAMVQHDSGLADQLMRWTAIAAGGLLASLTLDAELEAGTLGQMPDTTGGFCEPVSRADVRRAEDFTVLY